jgi:hypothetical protein
MKFPSVYPLTIPSSHKMIRMIAMVSSMGVLLREVRLFDGVCRATRGASHLSNGYARPLTAVAAVRLPLTLFTFAVLLLGSGRVEAQENDLKQKPSNKHRAASTALFLAGAATGLGAHETGHLLFDGIFDAHPRVKRVSFHGIPFFAITHDATVSARKEFVIDSAGFWVQHAGNEIILWRDSSVRRNGSPFIKGLFAFNVVASLAYSTAALARTGPVERDTRGMADALRWKEPFIGLLILAPAVLDAVRYYRPDAKWAVWSSRGVKVGMILLVFR